MAQSHVCVTTTPLGLKHREPPDEPSKMLIRTGLPEVALDSTPNYTPLDPQQTAATEQHSSVQETKPCEMYFLCSSWDGDHQNLAAVLSRENKFLCLKAA